MKIPIELFPEQADVHKIAHIYSFDSDGSQVDCDHIFTFWRNSIANYCLVNNTTIISLSKLHEYFTLYEIEPSSLNACYDKLLSANDVVPKEKMKNIDVPSISEALYYVSTIIFPQLKVGQIKQEMVYIPFLRMIVDKVIVPYINQYHGGKYACFKDSATNEASHLNIMKEFSFQGMLNEAINHMSTPDMYLHDCIAKFTTEDLQNIIFFMIKNKLLSMIDQDKICYIDTSKMLTKATTTGSTLETAEVAVAKLRLKYSIKTLEMRIKGYEQKIDDFLLKARSYKTRGDDKVAMMYLQMKKNTKQNHEKLVMSHMTLLDANERMEGMSDMVMIRDAFVTATSGLKVTREAHDLSVENVEEAQEALYEELEVMDTISNAIIAPSSSTIEEEESLLEELNELMTSVQQDKDKDKDTSVIPTNTLSPNSAVSKDATKPEVSIPITLSPPSSSALPMTTSLTTISSSSLKEKEKEECDSYVDSLVDSLQHFNIQNKEKVMLSSSSS